MMKKVFWLVLLCALCSVGVNAQSAKLVDAYNNWKSSVFSNSVAEGVHYGLAVSTKRTSGNRAELEFMSVGHIGDFALKITPVFIQRDEAGKIVKETEGEVVTAKQSSEESKLSERSQLNVIVPVSDDSNAIKIEWNFTGNGEKMSSTLLVPLETESSVNFIGIIPKDSAIPLCPGCVVVSGSNDRCGFFYKCCRNYIGNSIDFVACTVHCGSDC